MSKCCAHADYQHEDNLVAACLFCACEGRQPTVYLVTAKETGEMFGGHVYCVTLSRSAADLLAGKFDARVVPWQPLTVQEAIDTKPKDKP